ncbi:MAG: IS3 family transposase [Christensenellales bacterium]
MGLRKHTFHCEIFAKAIAEYIDDYNNRRIQVKTKWMPPPTFREASMAMT